jgi:TPR repeat protein
VSIGTSNWFYAGVLALLVLLGGPGADAADAGWLYRMGRYDEAVAAWVLAADQGDPEAQYRLAQCYFQGIGTPRDPVKANNWLERAALGGHAIAAFNLAMLADRRGGDGAMMVKWLTLAADRGLAEAHYNLATLLEAGDKVPRDLVEAYAHYRAAAEKFGSVAHNENLERLELTLKDTDLNRAKARAAALLGKSGG